MFVILANAVDYRNKNEFRKAKTYQSNNALKKSQKPAGLWDFI